jgi:hypothetical protein
MDNRSLFGDWFGWIPDKGFKWSIGTEAITGLPGTFLSPLSITGKRRAVTDQEAYLDFARVKGVELPLLEFANQHGCLGVPKEHFHTVAFVEWGESLRSWQRQHERFRIAFKLWQATSDRDIRKVKVLMTQAQKEEAERRPLTSEAGLCGADEQLTDPFVAATKVVVYLANCGLRPQENALGKPCCVPGCTEWKIDKIFNKTTPWVEPTIEVREAGKAVTLVLLDKPMSLLAAMWLQFAEFITGKRRVRLCEECGEYMDVTSSVRPGAKRIHERCSNNARARRWRHRNKEND